jgi:serine/threonine-protein kinase
VVFRAVDELLARRAGLVHRDVKPGNLLIDVQPGRPDHVYLSDFGLSKGALSAAPEQIEGRPVDGRADQYALACTAFELLTGEAPFQRDQAGPGRPGRDRRRGRRRRRHPRRGTAQHAQP